MSTSEHQSCDLLHHVLTRIMFYLLYLGSHVIWEEFCFNSEIRFGHSDILRKDEECDPKTRSEWQTCCLFSYMEVILTRTLHLPLLFFQDVLGPRGAALVVRQEKARMNKAQNWASQKVNFHFRTFSKVFASQVFLFVSFREQKMVTQTFNETHVPCETRNVGFSRLGMLNLVRNGRSSSRFLAGKSAKIIC